MPRGASLRALPRGPLRPQCAPALASSGAPVHSHPPDVRRHAFLSTLGLPPGISEEILMSCKNFPLRIWVIDNSGSMATGDGHKLVTGPAGREGLEPCSRWGELGDAILWHAKQSQRGFGGVSRTRGLGYRGMA